MAISQRSQTIIDNAALAAGGLGIPGIFVPGVDIAGMAVIWGKMVMDLAEASGHKVDAKFGVKMVSSLTAGVTLYIGGGKLMTWFLNFIPGIGSIAAAGINAMFNWIYTLRLGKLVANQFSKPGFDAGTLLISASGLASMVFAIPTLSEFQDAFGAIGHLLDGGSHVSHVADAVSTASDVASHTSHAVSAAGDIHSHVTGLAHQDLTRFGGIHATPVLMSTSDIFNLQLSDQRELLQTVVAQHPAFAYLSSAVHGTAADLKNAFLQIESHPNGDVLFKIAKNIRFRGVGGSN